MRNIDQIKDLVKCAINKTAPADFSTATVSEVEDTLRAEMNGLASDFNTYRRHQLDVFEIIQEAVDLAAPKKVMDIFGQFAEIRQFNNGAKPQFKIRRGVNRAKRFVTRATASGVYRAFRLDSDVIDVDTFAIGNAAYIDFERYMSGDEDMAEVASIIVESFQDAVMEELQRALRATINESSRPTANKQTDSSFSAANLAKLCATVRAYGNGAVIFATPEFIATMGPDEIKSGITPNVSVNDIEDIRTKGYIGIFRGCPIVQLPQSYTDDTNTHTLVDPQIAYVFPTGGEKIVKVAFEGNTIVKQWDNRDNSMELQAYKKLGIAILNYNSWAIYRNTGITQTYEGPAL